MSSCRERLPVELNPFRMAELRRQFTGSIEFKQMKRLASVLESQAGQLDAELEFGIDEQGISYLRGKLSAELILQCQRCLGEMRYPVENEFCLALLRNEAGVAQLSSEYEPLIIATLPVRLADLLEDEVLLSLPQIARHELNECPVHQFEDGDTKQDESATKQNPFAVLADLKKEH